MSTSEKSRYRQLIEPVTDRVDNFYLYLLLLPVLLVLIAFLWYPLGQGVWISFHEWPLVGEHQWAGLENYVNFINSDIFFTSLRVTLIMAFAAVPQMIVGMGAALAIYHTTRLQNALSASFLLPFILPPVASGTIIYFFLSTDFGPVFPALLELGILDSPILWRIESLPALAVVVGSLIWTYWPWAFIIFLARRQSIPDDLYESAKMYGASRWEMFRYITLPHMRGVIAFVLIFRIVNNISKVAQNLQLTGGGPGFSTSPLALSLYRFAWQNSEMGRAISVGVIMLIVGLIFAIPILWVYERSTQEAEQEVA